MKRREFLSGLAGATACAMTSSAAAVADSGVADGPIDIGQSAPFSGPSAALGLEMKDGMEACLAEVNRAGGVHGRPLRLIPTDDAYEPDRALANAEQLAARGVFAFCGFVGTPTSLKVLPLVTALRIPFIGAFTGAQALRTPMNRYVFNVRAGYDLEAKKLVNQLTSFSDTARIGLFIQDDAYGEAVRVAIMSALQERGLQPPVAIAKVPRNATDAALEGAVARAVDAFKSAEVSGVALGSVYGACTKLVEALTAARYRPMLASVSFVGTSNLLHAGIGARGIAIAQVMPAPMYPTLKVTQDYARAMANAGKSQLSYGSIEGYVAFRTLVAGLHRCGPNPTRERLISALESGPLDLGDLTLRFSPANHSPSTFVEMTQVTEDLSSNGNRIVR